MKDLVIPAKVLEQMHLTGEQVLIELAVYLYSQQKLTMGQARRLADLDQLSFQHELAKRDVYIHYTIEEIKKDVENLQDI